MWVVFSWRGVDACHLNSHFADEKTRETKLKSAGSLPGYAAIAGERDFITRRGELSSAADVFRVQGGADRHFSIQTPGRYLRRVHTRQRAVASKTRTEASAVKLREISAPPPLREDRSRF